MLFLLFCLYPCCYIYFFLFFFFLLFFFFFFFQAEDGIRDLTVTGVQTCALPIFGRKPLLHDQEAARQLRDVGRFGGKFLLEVHAECPIAASTDCAALRSEIGRASCRKECRSRWSPYHEKKKIKERR